MAKPKMAKRKPKVAKNALDLAGATDVTGKFKPKTSDFNHTRMESMIPMRDGVKLFTVI